jgi:hypothetical protein
MFGGGVAPTDTAGNLATTAKEAAMNRELARKVGAHPQGRTRAGPVDPTARAMSRRRFAREAGGAAAVVAALGPVLWRPAAADDEDERAQPVPIPGGNPNLGGRFHVFGPGKSAPADAEPSTITDLNGFVGLAFISGMVNQTNTVTGEVRTLPFVGADMRFMKGTFRGTDGEVHRGAFALV